MTSLRRLIALLCLVTILVVAINPLAPGIFVALLVPLFFFLASVANVVPAPTSENEETPAVPFLDAVASRGPPHA
jgi:MFS superfamily sulfate permease-like transporter